MAEDGGAAARGATGKNTANGVDQFIPGTYCVGSTGIVNGPVIPIDTLLPIDNIFPDTFKR